MPDLNNRDSNQSDYKYQFPLHYETDVVPQILFEFAGDKAGKIAENAITELYKEIKAKEIEETKATNFILENQIELENSSCEDFVLRINDLCKSYEEGKPVLNNLCMKVKRGSIYGLLGSSGCGKTSLLSCVVGLNRWDSGEIFLFGKEPQGHPSRKVGFMPQDVSLYDQVSIREMMGYYGLMYGMSSAKIKAQWIWLRDFLQLPSEFKLIKDLSGGQQRRASLSLCLLHSPELLILDEPTVGLDPLLRESIWQYLTKMVKSYKTTVIVTTHYIEETRLSNTIGVMRNGKLIAEESPSSLLQRLNCDLLEQAVLRLCHVDEGHFPEEKEWNPQKRGSIFSLKSLKSVTLTGTDIIQEGYKKTKRRMSNISNISIVFGGFQDEPEGPPSKAVDRVRAFCTIVWLLFWRNPIFMVMILFLPTIQIILTLAVIGTQPKNLAFGVVDQDSSSFDFCFTNHYSNYYHDDEHNHEIFPILNHTDGLLAEPKTTCDLQYLGCRVIKELSRSGIMTLTPLKSIEQAQQEMYDGSIWGYFHFQANFSQYMQSFVLERRYAEEETLDGTRLPLVIDKANYLGSLFSIQEAFEAYQRFLKGIAFDCGVNPKEAELPLFYRDPVYGNGDSTIQDYIVPIAVIMVLFEVPMMVTSILFINDRKQGNFDRALVAGLKFSEVMITHFITQGSVIIGQTAICFATTSFFYNFGVSGSMWLYFLFCVLGGLCGEGFGLLMGILCYNEVEAVLTGILVGPILLVLAGALWPMEMMKKSVQLAAYCSPTSLFIASIRAVAYKGLGLFHQQVWPGIAIIIGWTVAFWILSVLIFIRKRQ